MSPPAGGDHLTQRTRGGRTGAECRGQVEIAVEYSVPLQSATE